MVEVWFQYLTLLNNKNRYALTKQNSYIIIGLSPLINRFICKSKAIICWKNKFKILLLLFFLPFFLSRCSLRHGINNAKARLSDKISICMECVYTLNINVNLYRIGTENEMQSTQNYTKSRISIHIHLRENILTLWL